MTALLLLLALLNPPAPDDVPADVPHVRREMRGVWVATVQNIDWPSAPGLPPAEQRAEAVRLLDAFDAAGLNTVILQVRPAGDALYPSELEPWSAYLTGEQGTPPEPLYDPLAFWIDEAHARGLELHAWVNPFRVRHKSFTGDLAETSIANTHPEAVVEYGGYLWLDPAHPAARRRVLDVVADLTARYDLDGVHIDDYFYPYPVAGRPFPDEASHAAHRAAGGTLDVGDFRRARVDDLVRALWGQIKADAPHVKFGISPFGIWRPGSPPGVRGMDAHAALHADARRWLHEGWCDYFTPQLYWPIAAPGQSFPALLGWWAGENRHGRTLAPGLYAGRLFADNGDWPLDELAGQVKIARHWPGVGGQVHYSAKAIAADAKGIAGRLGGELYAEPALPPAMTWAVEGEGGGPAAPTLTPAADGLRLSGAAAKWEVWTRAGDGWTCSILPGGPRTLPAATTAVRAVDRFGRAGPAALHVTPERGDRHKN